jgi:microcystin-dependent protein
MSEPFLGELRLFPYNFAPVGWAMANGQTMAISQNTALFSLLGTTYGGNGTTTFQLPDLRGRVPVSMGQAAGLSPYVLGETLGVESVTLNIPQIPAHTHTVNANGAKGNDSSPIGSFPAADASELTAEYSTSSSGTMNSNMLSTVGGTQPHENRQPTLVLSWCIALQGIFPSRN